MIIMSMTMIKDFQIIYTDNFKTNDKKQFIKALYLAFATQNVNYIIDLVEDDIEWNIIDTCSIKGKAMYATSLQQMIQIKIKKLHIKNIIINGQICAINGIAHSYGNKNYSFCDIIQFSSTEDNAKIKKITSYSNSLFNEVCNSYYH